MRLKWKTVDVVSISGSDESREAAVVAVSVGVRAGAVDEEDADRAVSRYYHVTFFQKDTHFQILLHNLSLDAMPLGHLRVGYYVLREHVREV